MVKDNVTRIELKIRQNLAKNSSIEEIFDDKYLLGIMKNYLRKHTDILKKLPGENITLYRKKKNRYIDDNTIQSIIYENNRDRKVFFAYGKKIFEMGLCPTRLLIAEGYIKKETKDILGIDNINDIIKKEIIAKKIAGNFFKG